MLVVNIFGGPHAGKTTAALDITAALKIQHIRAVYVSEYVQDVIYDEAFVVLQNQIKIFGEQLHKVQRLEGKVDVVICDSPLLLSIIYGADKNLPAIFDYLVLHMHNRFNNLNYFLHRPETPEHDMTGRIHNKEEAIEIDKEILGLFFTYQMKFRALNADDNRTKEIITNDILKKLREGIDNGTNGTASGNTNSLLLDK